MYNFAITTNLDYDEMELNTILNSIKAEELDSSKIGKLMRNDPEDTLNTAKSEIINFQFLRHGNFSQKHLKDLHIRTFHM